MEPLKQLLQRAFNETREIRVALFERSFAGFYCYYFATSFFYKIPPFHALLWRDLEDMADGELEEVLWIIFRESAKTTIAKSYVIWLICYRKKRYINWDSRDGKNAESALFDIIVQLQTNQKLIEDYGHLYTEDRSMEEKKLKKIGSFITSNKIKVEAFSTNVSTRGRLYDNYRPDQYVLDDIENVDTIRSGVVTQGIIDHINELKSGKSPNGAILYLGNYLSDAGVIRFIRDKVSQNPKGIVRDITVTDRKTLDIVWKDKYVRTDQEAAEVNKNIPTPDKWKVSLESKRRSLGDDVYEQEMMNNPAAKGGQIFDRVKIDELIGQSKPPRENKAEFLLWANYNPSHRYAIGADTAEGVGQDSNASVLIDFSQNPNEQVGSYANDRIAPDIFAYELKRQGDMFGTCLIAPEVNNTGFATLTQLKTLEYDQSRIYRREEKDKVTNAPTKKLGWRTTSATKPEVIFGLKKAIEEGALVIRDERILKEAREYSQVEMNDGAVLATRHFDLLMACAIAWAMRTLATVSDSAVRPYKQKAYEPTSRYEGPGPSKVSTDPFDPLSEIFEVK